MIKKIFSTKDEFEVDVVRRIVVVVLPPDEGVYMYFFTRIYRRVHPTETIRFSLPRVFLEKSHTR